MRLFRLTPEIHKFDKFKDFVEEFILSKEDLLVVSESIYNVYVSPLNLDLNVIFPKRYGDGEPSDHVIDKVIEESKKYDYSRIIAIGGGAILDIAKLLVLKDISNTLDIFEKNIDFVKEKELVMIPTTCGTGSEVTNFSVAEIKSKNTKMGVGIDELFPDKAVLIPELLEKLPYKVFAFSSIDALVHAIESFLSPKANIYTDMFAIEAIKLILKGYINLLDNGKENISKFMDDFVIGSNFAGIAFGNTGVAAVHALAYPLGGIYHVAHGEANYQFLVGVLKLYSENSSTGKINHLNKTIGDILKVKDEEAIEVLGKLLEEIFHKKSLREYGMKESEIVEFTDSVIENQQRLLSNNYREISREEILNIYKTGY
jgi:4-hydroxybutyrate dehydrogenase